MLQTIGYWSLPLEEKDAEALIYLNTFVQFIYLISA